MAHPFKLSRMMEFPGNPSFRLRCKSHPVHENSTKVRADEVHGHIPEIASAVDVASVVIPVSAS